MKYLLASLILFSIATTCSGVGNRVFEELTALRRIGFEFKGITAPAQDTVSFEVKVPNEFLVAEDLGTKPFAGISLVQFTRKVEPGAELMGAPSSQVLLESRKSGDGHHVARVTVSLATMETSYLMVSFVHPGEGQWPLLVHVPVSGLVKQLESEQAAAADRPATPGLNPGSAVRGAGK